MTRGTLLTTLVISYERDLIKIFFQKLGYN